VRRWARFVSRHRAAVLLTSMACFVLSIAGLLSGGQPVNESDYNVESTRAATLAAQQLPAAVGSSFGLVLTDPAHTYDQAAFRDEVDQALRALRADPRVSSVATPYDGDATDAALVSSNGHSILVNVGVDLDFSQARAQFGSFRSEVHTTALQVATAGDVPLAYDFDTQLAADLRRAEVVSLPLALLLLLVVFGTVVAALLCLGVGVLAVLGGSGAVGLLAHFSDMSTYAQNVVTLIGLGVAIDYSLFVVTRFREELAKDGDVQRSLEVTLATAGRAIAFSGLTVAIGLAALLFYTGTPLTSMGIAGGIVVGISVLYGLTFLPAMLAVLGPRTNRLRMPILQPRPVGQGAWHRLAMAVMRRPVLVLLPTVALLLLAGTPFLSITLANSDVEQLPPSAESRVGAQLLQADFPALGQNQIEVVMQFVHGSPLAPDNVATAYAASRSLAALPGVVKVESYVDSVPGYGAAQYQRLYAAAAPLPSGVQSELHQSVGRSIALLDIDTPYLTTSDQAHELVRSIRAHDSFNGATTLVTGDTAFDIDLVDYMVQRTPAAVVFVVVSSFVVLLLLLRSLVLPLKAVLMNALSLSAAFGALVWVFEQGHLAGLLGFTPGPLDPTIPVLLFCVAFGLSMDYEVFLLTRMQEAWRRTHDNRLAVADGLERSGRLVTGAAAIMASVFLAFALASVVTIKSIGVGMAVAVIVDATLVRAMVVPATMRLLGRVNWYAPRWLRRRVVDGEVPEAA
jgi:putative drug exporter of the RND superfamily